MFLGIMRIPITQSFIKMKCNSLEEVRSNIDRIDNEIIKLIAERTDYVKQASSFKKSEDGVKAPKRVEAVIQKVREKAAEAEPTERTVKNVCAL